MTPEETTGASDTDSSAPWKLRKRRRHRRQLQHAALLHAEPDPVRVGEIRDRVTLENEQAGLESFVCAPDGSVVACAPRGEEHTLAADLDLAAVLRSHVRGLFFRDRRPELYRDLFARGGPGVRPAD